jgi:pectate lyase
MLSLIVTILAIVFSAGFAGAAPLLAFPGADGFGAYAKGGRGGKVVRVTNLNKRGAGSFTWALNEVKEPRTIVFDVSGVIDCNNEISFLINADNDHVTIAGETSLGGIAIYNYRNFVIRDGAEEVIMRFLRFRGTRIHTKNDPDGLLIWRASNVIVDHCSFAGACDETISTSLATNVTIQWTGYDESRKEKAHNDYFANKGQWHNYGGLYSRSTNISIHHCLFAHQSKRNPLVDKYSNVEAVNNVIYNYSNGQQTWGAAGEGLKIAGCYFKLGPDRRKRPIPVRDNVKAIKACFSVKRDGSPGPPVDDLGKLGKLTLNRAHTASQAYRLVLQESGALPHDATSKRMAEETFKGTGRQGYAADIEADRQVLANKARFPDSDQDGIPDVWEIRRRLDHKNPDDATGFGPFGYTHIEHYCHERARGLLGSAR